ncbi:MAG: hypothetical protein ACYTFT_09495 [Planctomycetota bacterium]|jgi:hypothetical protein
MSYTTREWLQQASAYERELENQLQELQRRRQEQKRTEGSVKEQRTQAVKAVAASLLTELTTEAIARLQRVTGMNSLRGQDPLSDVEKERAALRTRNTDIETNPRYADRAKLRDPLTGTLTTKREGYLKDREPLLRFFNAAQHDRLVRLMATDYGTEDYAVGWWRMTYYGDWKAGDEVVEQIQAIEPEIETFKAFREKYEDIQAAKATFDAEIEALDAEIRAGEKLEAEHASNLAAIESAAERKLESLRTETLAFLGTIEPSWLASRVAAENDPDLDLLMKRWAGLAKKEGYLVDLQARYLDEPEQRMTKELNKLRRQIVKYRRPKHHGKRFDRSSFNKRFKDRSSKYTKHWSSYDKRARAVSTFDRYDLGSLDDDFLWWDAMSDGRLDGSFSEDVTRFREQHPDYRYERPVDEDYAAATAAWAGSGDSLSGGLFDPS